MFKKFFIILIFIAIVFVAIVTMQPSDFRISRSLVMSAPPEAVFAQVIDFHKWQAWSPWVKMDPAAKNDYGGPGAGVGAMFHWAGNRQVGEGTMTITEIQSNALVRIRLAFLKPFAATDTGEFTFMPQGKQTLVTWSMSGRNNFIGKAMGLFINCDKMVGGEFEKGLSQMKAIVEAAATTKKVAAPIKKSPAKKANKKKH